MQPQFTCQASTVTDNSLTLSAALLVHPSGTTHFILDCRGFIGLQNDARPNYLWLCHSCSWIVQECGFHVKRLIFGLNSCGIFLVFANQVTYLPVIYTILTHKQNSICVAINYLYDD